MPNTAYVKASAVALVTTLLLTVVAVRSSEASPMTWLYTGSVVSTFDSNLVPLGSEVTTLFTADPDANVWAGNLGCGPHPNGGGYLFSATIAFNGQQYTYSGALEVNYDFTHCQDLGDFIRVVPFGLTGPPLGIWHAGPQGTQQGAYLGGNTDPNSPAFPSAEDLSFLLRFDPDLGRANVRVTAASPQAVPEPTSLLLLGTALAALAGRRLRRRGMRF